MSQNDAHALIDDEFGSKETLMKFMRSRIDNENL